MTELAKSFEFPFLFGRAFIEAVLRRRFLPAALDFPTFS